MKKNPKSKRREAEIRLCECGCGEPSPISNYNDKRFGHVKGKHVRFIPGHNSKGSNNPMWNGGVRKDKRDGRVYLHNPSHGRSDSRGYVKESIFIAEKAFGKRLPKDAIIHHVDSNPGNNSKNNIVICESQKYHMLIHMRTRALNECGNANYRKCCRCGNWDVPKKLKIINTKAGSTQAYHQKCNKEHNRIVRNAKKRKNS